MSEKKTGRTLGWNPTYFGEPKKGSLAATIADITTKQNELVGGKPEVQSSAAEQAKEQKQEAMNPAQQAAIAIDMKKKGKKPKNEDDAADMRKKNKDDAKGETPVKVHGEDLNKEIENAKMGKVKSLVDTIKDMFYTPEAVQKELTDKQKKLPPALQKAIKAKEKNEDLEKDDEKDVKDVIKGLKKAQGLHKKQADNLAKQIKDGKTDEKLVGGQKKLDKDKDGDIDGKDFAMLRKSKK